MDPPRLSLRDDQATCDVELDLWEGRTAHGAGTSVGSEGNEQGMPSRQDMDDEARVKMAQDLICMGQPLEVCVQALRLANDDLEQAMAWLLSPAAARMAQQMEYQRQAHQTHKQLTEGISEPPPDRSEYDTLE